MKNYKLIFLFIFIGCTSLSQKLQNVLEKKENVTPIVTINSKKYCDSQQSSEFLLEDSSFISNATFKYAPFSFIEKSVLLALNEMSRRPDTTGPFSRLQIYTKLKGEVLYFDFRPKNLADNSSTPYLYGLNFLLKKDSSKQSLISLAKLLEKPELQHISVSSEFESFLSMNKKDINKSNLLTEMYLKGDEVLTRFETFKRPNLVKALTKFEKDKNFDPGLYDYDKNSLIYSIQDESSNSTKCNFDIAIDSLNPHDLTFNNDYVSNSFTFTEGTNFFIAIASSHIKKPLEISQEIFFKARPTASPIPLCQLKNKDLNSELIISSINGRYPSQHLKHLINYDIINVNSLDLFSNTINFARHLFLTNPDRILYESKKGRKEQLNFFLQMNFPIYHVDQLGEIMTLASLNNKKNYSIIKDERSSKQLICNP